MNGIYVPLNETERAQLITLALTERRSPQDQAALFIARALDEAKRWRSRESGGQGKRRASMRGACKRSPGST